MSTINVILMLVLITMIVATAMLIIRNVRKQSKLETKAAELEAKERGLHRKEMDLENWKAKIDQNVKRLAEMKHIYANVEVYDNDENKPSSKSIAKSLSSKIGYAIRREFTTIRERHDSKNGGRTVYSVDFYVKPFED